MEATFSLKTVFTTASGTSFSRKRSITFPADGNTDFDAYGMQILHYTIPMSTSPTKVVTATTVTGNDFATIGASGFSYAWIFNRSETQTLKLQLTGSVSKVGYVSLAPKRWFMIYGLSVGDAIIDGEAIASIEGSFPVAGDEVEVIAFASTIES